MSQQTNGAPGRGDPATAFLEGLERWCAVDTSASAPALRAALKTWLRAAQTDHSSSALVHQLAARALEIADAGAAREDTTAALRAHLERSIAAERADLDAARAAVARTATELVGEREAWIATLGDGIEVRRALLQTQEIGRRPRVLVAEGRPRQDGRTLATALAAAGIPVWLVVDAALPLLLSQARAVWIGAEAVTDRGVIQRVGGYAAALAAREHSVPVYALATRRAFLPATTRALKIAEFPPEEVWREPAAGVRPRNVHHEMVPLELIRGVAVEDAVLGPGEVAVTALDRALPEELAGG